MKFLMMSATGDGAGIALKLKGEGHDVSIWIREGASKKNYDGLLRKTTSQQWNQSLERDTVVVFDTSGGGTTADRLLSRGHYIIGGSVLADELEQDRSLALAIMEEVGIKIPQSERFTSWERARKFVEGNADKRWVFKPSTDLGPLVSSYVPYDGPDLVEMLNYYEKVAEKGREGTEFILQEFKEGVAISSEGWFNGREWVKPFNQTLEKKGMQNDNLGPSCGCSGNVVWSVPPESNHIIAQGIEKMGPWLAEREYVGPLDLNAVVNEEGVWGLEFTPRFGYDATPTLFQMLLDEPVGMFLASLAHGDHPREMKLKEGFGAAVHISVPPYPSDKFHAAEGIPIRGWDRGDRPFLYFNDVLLNDENTLVTSPAYGNVAIVMGHGGSIGEAFEGAYKLADKAKVPNKQYRTDLSEALTHDHEKAFPMVEMETTEQ